MPADPTAMGPHATALWQRVWRRRVVTVLATGTLGVSYLLFFLGSSGVFGLHLSREEQVLQVALAVGFVGLEYLRAQRSARRAHRPLHRWLDGDSTADADVAAALDRLPAFHARQVGFEWAAAVAISVVTRLAYGAEVVPLGLVALSGLVYGVHIAWIVYLLVEDALAPALAELHATGAPLGPLRPLSLRLGTTLLLVAGVVFIGAVVVVTYPRPSGVDLTLALVPLAAFVTVEGGTVLVLTVRSLGERMERLRIAHETVRAGDASVTLPVDDRTEFGVLQHSFNEMSAALRDRAVLEQLLATHLGPGVAQVARAHGLRFDGRRREISILFVDMIDSTALAEEHAPESMLALLNDLFSTIVGVVEANGGEVLQLQGDGAICTFGAIDDLAGHADAALTTAERLAACLDGSRPGLRAAVGVSTGSVVVGHVGNAERATYTVVGSAANEANRLTEEAKRAAGRVLASGAVVSRASPSVRARWGVVGELQLRGLRRPTALWAPRIVCDGAGIG